MTVIADLKTYLATYSGLKSGAPVWVDYLGADPTQYSISPLAGEQVSEWYVDGKSERQFPFAFQSVESTADELERLETNGFFELFAKWLEDQTNTGVLPTLSGNKVATKIEALGWAYLYQQGQSDTGIYQVQCRLTYDQT
jgi:hypothetical protein